MSNDLEKERQQIVRAASSFDTGPAKVLAMITWIVAWGIVTFVILKVFLPIPGQ